MSNKKILKTINESAKNSEQEILKEATPNIKWLFSQYVNMRNSLKKRKNLKI